MPTEYAYSSWLLVLSNFGTCICSNMDISFFNLPFSGHVNLEHSYALLFYFNFTSSIATFRPTSPLPATYHSTHDSRLFYLPSNLPLPSPYHSTHHSRLFYLPSNLLLPSPYHSTHPLDNHLGRFGRPR